MRRLALLSAPVDKVLVTVGIAHQCRAPLEPCLHISQHRDGTNIRWHDAGVSQVGQDLAVYLGAATTAPGRRINR